MKPDEVVGCYYSSLRKQRLVFGKDENYYLVFASEYYMGYAVVYNAPIESILRSHENLASCSLAASRAGKVE